MSLPSAQSSEGRLDGTRGSISVTLLSQVILVSLTCTGFPCGEGVLNGTEHLCQAWDTWRRKLFNFTTIVNLCCNDIQGIRFFILHQHYYNRYLHVLLLELQCNEYL